MLWIFKVARWTRDKCPKINKSPNVSNGIRASSFKIWTANLLQSLTVGTLTLTELHLWRFTLEILQSRLPCRPSKTWHSDADISDLGIYIKIMLLFFSDFLKNLLEIYNLYKNTVTVYTLHNLGKIRSELKLLFGVLTVYYWFLKLYTGIIWHSYFPSQGIS